MHWQTERHGLGPGWEFIPSSLHDLLESKGVWPIYQQTKYGNYLRVRAWSPVRRRHVAVHVCNVRNPVTRDVLLKAVQRLEEMQATPAPPPRKKKQTITEIVRDFLVNELSGVESDIENLELL